MGVWTFLTGLVQPLTTMIDNVHTSDEERLQLRNELAQMQNQLTVKVLDYEKELLKSKASIITAEAQGESWLQRSWRPITMLTFLVLIICDQTGLLAFRLSDQAWELLKIGISGYIIGRSGEKGLPGIINAVKGNKEIKDG